jgi:hypothetical protein
MTSDSNLKGDRLENKPSSRTARRKVTRVEHRYPSIGLYINDGKPGTAIQNWGDMLSELDIWNLIAYIFLFLFAAGMFLFALGAIRQAND